VKHFNMKRPLNNGARTALSASSPAGTARCAVRDELFQCGSDQPMKTNTKPAPFFRLHKSMKSDFHLSTINPQLITNMNRSIRLLFTIFTMTLPLAGAKAQLGTDLPSGLISWWRAEGNTADETGTHPGTARGALS